MVNIPEQQAPTPEQMFERLQVWFGMQQQLGDIRTAEKLARDALAGFYFPTPEEGTNRLPLGLGFDLKLVHSINRTVDEAALNALGAPDLAKIEELKVPMAQLFKQTWELSTGAYKKLNAKQRAFVDKLLVIKPGSPQMAIVPVADAEGQAAHQAAAQPEQAPFKYDVNLGAEDDTQPGQYFRDAEGVWWLLDADEWQEVAVMATLEELEAYWVGATAKPKRTRKPRAAKGGAA